MDDIAIETAADAKLAEIERRVQALETKVAALPDAQKIEEHVTEWVKASLPQPVDPTAAPSFKDISLPIPNVESLVTTARTTWAVLEMLAEIKLLLWMLVDRRYHMGWLTRIVTIGLLLAILVSHWWIPFAGYDNFVSRLIDKAGDLVLGLILFMLLSYETRRYKEWRKGR
ncbi:MAG: hypothetical protein HYX68_26155 [Planctomycetes bacterium]|nr:hypothetical protein [Planctomycetota bacterium]